MRRGALVAILVALVSSPVVARAQAGADAAMAEQLFREARALMTAGRYAEACPKLAESHHIDPGVGTLINLGECYEKQGKLASAWAVYREAGPMARRLGQLPRARFADARASALAESFSTVTLRIAEATAGLVVTLDDRPMPEVAWRTAIPIDAGHHTIGATAPKRRAWQATFDVDPAVPAAKVVIEVPPLEALPEPAPVKVEPTPHIETPPRPGQTQRVLGWVGLGLGGASLAAGSVFGLMAKSKNDEASSHCSAVDCDGVGVELTDQAQTRAAVSTVFFASAGALLVAGIVLFVTAPRGGSATRSTPALAVW